MKRHSAKRDAIYNALRGTTSHPSASQLYTRLLETIPGLSQGTVYRVLRELIADGKARTAAVVDGVERFDARVEDHPHFACTCCKQVIDLPISIDRQIMTALRETGYEPQQVDMTVTGICETCRRERPDGLHI